MKRVASPESVSKHLKVTGYIFRVSNSVIFTFASLHSAIRLISVEDVRNYLSHIIYILIFDFFLNFLLFVRLQIPTSSIMVSERQMRFNVKL